MVYKVAEEQGREPRWPEVEHAIRRNFGGLDEIKPVEIFKQFALGESRMVGILSVFFSSSLPTPTVFFFFLQHKNWLNILKWSVHLFEKPLQNEWKYIFIEKEIWL